MKKITGYEVREDILDDGTPIFDVYQLMAGDAEYVDSYYGEDSALKHARICAKDNGLGECETKVHRMSS